MVEAEIDHSDILSAAILHDTIDSSFGNGYSEDATRAYLTESLGQGVASILMEVIIDKNLTEIDQRKRELEICDQYSQEATLVRLATMIVIINDILWNNSNNIYNGRSSQIVEGYHSWCYAVAMKIKGLNEVLDNQLNELFKIVGLENVSEIELNKRVENYYLALE